MIRAEQSPLGRAGRGGSRVDPRYSGIAIGLGIGLVAIGLLGGASVLVLALVVAAASAAAWFAPELYIVAFLAAGPVKDTPLAESLPFDTTAAATIGLIAAILVTLWRHRAAPISFPLPVAAFVALAALMGISALRSPDPTGGMAKLITFETLSALALFAPLLIIRGRRSMVRFSLGLVALGLLTSFFAVETDHTSHPLVLPGSGSEIDVALLAGMGVVAVVGYLWALTPGLVRLLWLAPIGYMLSTVISAGSRGALLGVIVASSLAVVFQILRLRSARVAAIGLFALLVVAAPVVVLTSSPQAQDKYIKTLQGGEGGLQRLDAGGGGRSDITVTAVDMFVSNPLGVGTAGYPALSGYVWPHNIILELGAELGVLGIGLFLALLVGTCVALARASLVADKAPEAIGAAALLLVPLVLSLSSFDLNGNRFLWAMLGVALAVGVPRPRRARYLPPQIMGSGSLAAGAPARPRSFSRPSVAAGGFEGLAVRVVEASLAVGLVIVTARLMEPSGRGLFALASLTATLCSLPLGSVWSAAAIDIAHHRRPLRDLLGACLAIAVVGGALTALVAFSIVPLLGDAWWVVALPAAATPAILLARYQEGLFQGIGHVRAVNMISIARIGLPLVLIATALLAGADDEVAVAAWTAALALLPILFWTPLRRIAGGVRIPRERREYRRLVGVGGTMIVANSALLLSTRIALVALAIFATTSDVGVYSVAIAAAEVLYMATYALVSSAFHRIGSGQRETSSALTARAARHAMILTVLGAAILVPTVFVTLPWLVGPGYEEVPALLVGLVPGVLAFAVWWVVQTFFVVQLARPAVAARITAIGLTVTLVLTFALVPLIGMAGAVIASTTGNLLVAVLGLRRFRQETGLPRSALVPALADLRDYRLLVHSIPLKGGSR